MTKSEAIAYEKRRAAEVASAYARLLTESEDGRRVLDDLKAKYDPTRGRFDNAGQFDPCAMRAAFRDGQSSVLNEILEAVKTGLKPTNQTNL